MLASSSCTNYSLAGIGFCWIRAVMPENGSNDGPLYNEPNLCGTTVVPCRVNKRCMVMSPDPPFVMHGLPGLDRARASGQAVQQ